MKRRQETKLSLVSSKGQEAKDLSSSEGQEIDDLSLSSEGREIDDLDAPSKEQQGKHDNKTSKETTRKNSKAAPKPKPRRQRLEEKTKTNTKGEKSKPKEHPQVILSTFLQELEDSLLALSQALETPLTVPHFGTEHVSFGSQAAKEGSEEDSQQQRQGFSPRRLSSFSIGAAAQDEETAHKTNSSRYLQPLDTQTAAPIDDHNRNTDDMDEDNRGKKKDNGDIERKQSKTRTFLYATVGVTLVLTMATVLCLAFFLDRSSSSGGLEPPEFPGENETIATTEPPLPPLDIPTSRPTTIVDDTRPPRDEIFLPYVTLLTSVSGEDVFLDSNSPQYQAMQWIAFVDDHPSTSQDVAKNASTDLLFGIPQNPRTEQLVQRYLLALLYYTTGGEETWKRDDALHLLADNEECNWWWTSEERNGLSEPYANGRHRQGVTQCDSQGHLTALTLDDAGLEGTLPFEIYHLSHLVHLDLSYNWLHGPLLPPPPSEEDSVWTKIQTLELHHNKFSGSLPVTLGLFTSLQTLHVHHNALSGTVPQAMKTAASTTPFLPTTITSLQWQHNRLSGPFPTVLLELDALTYLDVSSNVFLGTIPAELSLLTNLQHFNASNNRWHGPLTLEDATSWTSVTMLDLHANVLFGSLPTHIGQLTNLRHLDLSQNAFSSIIPTQMAELTHLVSLHLAHNLLEGPMPMESLSFLTALETLHLEGNRLQGELTADMAQWRRLRYLNVSDNELKGILPEEVGLLVLLKHLDVSHNRKNLKVNHTDGNVSLDPSTKSGGCGDTLENASITGLHGFIPVEVGRLTYLQTLNLAGNCISGTIPDEVGNLQRLQVLDISENNVKGDISAELGFLERIVELRLRDNPRMLGPAPLRICEKPGFDLLRNPSFCPPQRTILKRLYDVTGGERWSRKEGWAVDQFDHCRWYGVLCAPSTGLVEQLDLRGNLLSGTIPWELGHLTSLTHLALDRNRLQGTIPPALARLTQLQQLSLSENRLSGTVPLEFGDSLRELEILSLAENRFRGDMAVLTKFPKLIQLLLRENKFTGSVDSILESLLRLSTLQEANLADNDLTGSIPELEFDTTAKVSLDGNRLSTPAPAKLCHASRTYLLMDVLQSSQFCPERAFLQALYSATNGDSWLRSNGWNNDTVDVCDWHGVECNKTSMAVVSVDLTGNRCAGMMPSEIANLPYLHTVKFGRNRLVGSVPPSIWRMARLVNLDLSHNELTGRIPAVLGLARKMQNLTLAANQFHGSIPVQIEQMTYLQHMDLSNNSFSGDIPTVLDRLPVKSVKLRENRFSGAPPGNLCDKVEFDLKDAFGWCPKNIYREDTIMIASATILAVFYLNLVIAFLLRRHYSNANAPPQWKHCISSFLMWSGVQVQLSTPSHQVKGAEARSLKSWKMNTLAILMLLIQVGLAVMSAFVSKPTSIVEVSIALSGILGWYFALLAWPPTIPKESWSWSYNVSLVMLPLASVSGLLSVGGFTMEYVVFFLLLFFAWSIPCYLVTTVLQNLICKHWTGSAIQQRSVESMNRLSVGLLPIFYFSVRGVQEFKTATERESGMTSFFEHHLTGWISVFSGLVLLLTVLSNEVQQVSRLSLGDIILCRATWWELTASASNAALIFFALYLETVVSEINDVLAWTIICAMIVAPAVQLFSLWCVCRQILHCQHPFVQRRGMHSEHVSASILHDAMMGGDYTVTTTMNMGGNEGDNVSRETPNRPLKVRTDKVGEEPRKEKKDSTLPPVFDKSAALTAEQLACLEEQNRLLFQHTLHLFMEDAHKKNLHVANVVKDLHHKVRELRSATK